MIVMSAPAFAARRSADSSPFGTKIGVAPAGYAEAMAPLSPRSEGGVLRPLGLGLRGVGGVGASLAARHVAGRAGGAREADLSPEDWNRTERATPEADGDSGRRREIA